MMRRHLTPAVILFLVLLASCLCRAFLGGRWWFLLAAAVPVAAVSRVLLAPAAPGLRRAGLYLAVSAGGLAAGAVLLASMDDRTAAAYLPVAPARVTSFTASLVSDSTLTARGYSALRVRLVDAGSATRGLSGPARGFALLLVKGDHRYSLGQRIVVGSSLEALQPPGEQAWIAFPSRADIHGAGFTGRIWELRAEVRSWAHTVFEGAGYPASALMEALILGSREEIPPDLADGFKRTGSLHILALSGLHVTIIWGLLWGLFGFLRRRGVRTIAACLLLVFYQVIAGFMASLLRATVMVLVASAFLPLDRDREPVNLLAISGILLLLFDPFQVFSLSFQLSFLAMAGILVLAPLIQGPLSGHVPPVVLAPVSMSIAAQAATFPLIVSQFGVYYPSGVVAGLLLVPLTTALLWAGLFWLVLSAIPAPALHEACVRLFALLYDATEHVAAWFSRLPGLSVSDRLSPWLIAAGSAAAVAVALLIPRPVRGPKPCLP